MKQNVAVIFRGALANYSIRYSDKGMEANLTRYLGEKVNTPRQFFYIDTQAQRTFENIEEQTLMEAIYQAADQHAHSLGWGMTLSYLLKDYYFKNKNLAVMTEVSNFGQDIDLYGKSGTLYSGKMYEDKNSTTNYCGQAIVYLTNSAFSEGKWQHSMNSIYHVRDTTEALAHFSIRDDISHMIFIPWDPSQSNNFDKVDDLIRNYIHG